VTIPHNPPNLENFPPKLSLVFPGTGDAPFTAVYMLPPPPPLDNFTGFSGWEIDRMANTRIPAPEVLMRFLVEKNLTFCPLSFDPALHSFPVAVAAPFLARATEELPSDLKQLIPSPFCLLDERDVRVLRYNNVPVCLGEGSFGCVLLAQMVACHSLVAIKLFKIDAGKFEE